MVSFHEVESIMKRFAGIDVASKDHVVAIVDEDQNILVKPLKFKEDFTGYSLLKEKLGPSEGLLVCLEATGHYWKNLTANLIGSGYAVSVVNPLRTSRFAKEDLSRTKTDALDAINIARFAAQKRPALTVLPTEIEEELRELVKWRDRLVQELGDKTRQLHRLVNLTFPEFTELVKKLDSRLALSLLSSWPTARSFQRCKLYKIRRICYDGCHYVDEELGEALLEKAKTSVGAQQSMVYGKQIQFLSNAMMELKNKIKELDKDIKSKLDDHDIGKLLTSIDGIGAQTAARLVAELGNPAEKFKTPKQLASYIAAIPSLRQSGKRQSLKGSLSNVGHIGLRSALWMPMLVAVRKNLWIKKFYDNLVARGKAPKVALIAAMRKLLIAVHWVSKNQRPFVVEMAKIG